MSKQLTIALVAHDYRKADMVEWAVHNAHMLANHQLICTGTTGGLIQEAFKEKGIDVAITCMNSGPMGGRCRNCYFGGTQTNKLSSFSYRRFECTTARS